MILVVDDDLEYREVIVRHLRFLNYGVLEAATSDAALACLQRHEVDLVLLEIALGAHSSIKSANGVSVPPGSDGLDLLEIIRARPFYAPVIVLTVLDRATDEIASIQGGANIFLRKPVNISLLAAYVRSQLRSGTHIRAALQARFSASEQHSPPVEQPSILHANDLLIDTRQRLVRKGDGPYCNLSDREIRILAVLAKSPEKVFSKRELIRKAFGANADVSEQAVEAAVKRIRKKIEPGSGSAQYIVNARGMGYRFSGKTSAIAEAPRV
ncbi:MAG TPA: response regulator transcription factor [Terracidiphilus sp.]|nr:response regulator transcription factor [Terracidiphilus sp.]